MLNNSYVTPETVRIGDRIVRRQQPLLHGRRRSSAVLRRLCSRASASRTTSPATGNTVVVRRLRPVLRPRPVQLDARRALPPAVCGAHVPVLGRRRHSRRRADDRLESVVPERRGPRPDHRERPRADPRGVPDRQRHEAAGVGPVVARASATDSRRSSTSATYAGSRGRHLFTFIRGNRRPDGTCCLTVPGYSDIIVSDLEGRKAWYDALYVKADLPYGTGGRRWGFSFTYTLGEARADRRRSLQPRLPDGRGLPALSDQHRRASPGRDDGHRRTAVGLHRQHVHHARLGHAVHDQRCVTRQRPQPADSIKRNAGRPDQFAFIIPGRVGVSERRPAGREGVQVRRPQRVLGDLPGLQHLQLRQLQRLPGNIPTLPATNPNFGKPSSLVDPGRPAAVRAALRY